MTRAQGIAVDCLDLQERIAGLMKELGKYADEKLLPVSETFVHVKIFGDGSHEVRLRMQETESLYWNPTVRRHNLQDSILEMYEQIDKEAKEIGSRV